MITRIESNRYRCLENIGVDIPQYAVLVGANGAGKTTLLDIPSLLGDCMRQRDITQAFTQRQQDRSARCSSLKELVFQNKGTDFFIALEAALPEKTIRYELRLEIFNERQLQVKNEYLFLYSEKNKPNHKNANLYGENPDRDWRFIIKREYGGDADFRAETQKNSKSRSTKVEPAMLALPRIQFESKEEYPSASWFYDLITQDYLFYQPDFKVLQSASPPGLADTLSPNGINLPQLALALQEKDTMRFNLWQEHVKTAIPNIEHIELKEREEDHHVYFRIMYQGGYEVTSSGLSEGTIKILALTLLPYLNNLPAIVFIEEPENGIHPRAIETILQSLSSAYNSQILVSSHSPIVLANSELSQILCSRLGKNGAASIIPGSELPQLKDWKGHIDLGALFASGVLE
ncbi:MAG: ATP-binding protein [Hungatella sp.]|jgi:predicted ATPase|nr:ATP-binding protein [Hungatella sp.]